MSDIITETSGGVLRVELNRPARKNATTSGMDVGLAENSNGGMWDDAVRVGLWHAAGDDFCAGDDIGDFLSNPPGLGESQEAQLMKAFIALQADRGAGSGRRHRWRDHDADAPRALRRGQGGAVGLP
jgi:enoyl-CoA hydratase/carnithine racemase